MGNSVRTYLEMKPYLKGKFPRTSIGNHPQVFELRGLFAAIGIALVMLNNHWGVYLHIPIFFYYSHSRWSEDQNLNMEIFTNFRKSTIVPKQERIQGHGCRIQTLRPRLPQAAQLRECQKCIPKSKHITWICSIWSGRSRVPKPGSNFAQNSNGACGPWWPSSPAQYHSSRGRCHLFQHQTEQS